MSHSVYWCALHQIHPFLASYPVSITLFCVAPCLIFTPLVTCPNSLDARGMGTGREGKTGGFSLQIWIWDNIFNPQTKTAPVTVKCSVSPVYSPKWYCLLQSLNIMSWACKYMSMPYDHPPERNSKGSKKEQMPSYRFLFQQGLVAITVSDVKVILKCVPSDVFLATCLTAEAAIQSTPCRGNWKLCLTPSGESSALCLLWELSVCTKLSTTGPDLRLRGVRGALVAVLAQMRDIVQRN